MCFVCCVISARPGSIGEVVLPIVPTGGHRQNGLLNYQGTVHVDENVSFGYVFRGHIYGVFVVFVRNSN
jgi:hypothetical protein